LLINHNAERGDKNNKKQGAYTPPNNTKHISTEERNNLLRNPLTKTHSRDKCARGDNRDHNNNGQKTVEDPGEIHDAVPYIGVATWRNCRMLAGYLNIETTLPTMRAAT
jgi:hypothetical protein